MNQILRSLKRQLLQINQKKKLRLLSLFIGGLAPNLDKFMKQQKKYNILIIEDCRSQSRNYIQGKQVGNLSAGYDNVSTNPSPSKYAISRSRVLVTNNEEIVSRAKLLRTHAITTRYDSYGNLDYIYDVDDIGHKFDISELDAALCYCQLIK